MPNPPQSFTSRLIKKEELTRDTYSFYFERASTFEFIPGQYIKMVLNIENPDDRGTSRFFSIASSPTEKEHLMITTRILKSSFKKTLGSLPIGSEVQMRGPHGTFVLDEQDTKGKVYLAGGIGITPARSMLVYLRDKKIAIPFTLMVSFSNRNEIIFQEELNALSDDARKVAYVVTSEDGRIDEEKISKNVPDLLDSLFYISGPGGFVEAMEKLAKSMGVREENIKSEDFPGY
ncbi:MAG: FAD-dependent oxidoreductase [Candidatus Levybacteria bacterium]|nr:FAD-dependent oxidoreductase [Candidatus Levybacteria bacterium]